MRRRAASIQLSIATTALGVLAGVGLVKGAPPEILDAENAASKATRIDGSNIVDGSVKFNDINRRSFSKFLYFKTSADARFLKIRDAAAAFLKIEDAAGLYLKQDDAAATFLKMSDAAATFLKMSDAAATFLKMSDAAATFLKMSDAAATYLKLDDAAATYLKHDEAAATYLKHDEAAANYLKIAAADSRYVSGNGSVLTGSRLVGAEAETLLTVPETLRVGAASVQDGTRAMLTLTNLTDVALRYASSSSATGLIEPQSFNEIPIALHQPVTVQVIGPGDGGTVHTLNVTAYDESGTQLQVVGQALSGAGR